MDLDSATSSPHGGPSKLAKGWSGWTVDPANSAAASPELAKEEKRGPSPKRRRRRRRSTAPTQENKKHVAEPPRLRFYVPDGIVRVNGIVIERRGLEYLRRKMEDATWEMEQPAT